MLHFSVFTLGNGLFDFFRPELHGWAVRSCICQAVGMGERSWVGFERRSYYGVINGIGGHILIHLRLFLSIASTCRVSMGFRGRFEKFDWFTGCRSENG